MKRIGKVVNKGVILLQKKFECPLCKKTLKNPAELRDHRLENHKNVMDEIKFTI